MGLQHICREDFILNIKWNNKPIFRIFEDTTILRLTSDIGVTVLRGF